MNGSLDDSTANGLPLHYVRDVAEASTAPLSGVHVANTSTSALSARARRPTASMAADGLSSVDAPYYDPDDKKRDAYDTLDDAHTLAQSNNLSAAAFGSLANGPSAAASKPNKWESLVPDSKRRTGRPASLAQAIVRSAFLSQTWRVPCPI